MFMNQTQAMIYLEKFHHSTTKKNVKTHSYLYVSVHTHVHVCVCRESGIHFCL